jgi:serine/threonine protein phosphatase 1
VFGALRRVIGEWEARLFGEAELCRDEADAGAGPAQSPERIYAIGDVHGRADLLEDLWARIEEDARAAPDEPTTVVFLGDLVDRGPDSAKVVERVIGLRAQSPWRVQVLKGNHEQAMLLFLDDPAFGSTWLQHGGGPTLASYGVYPPQGRGDEAAWGTVRDAFAEALPPAHLAFLRSLPLYLERGDYLFVHAGVRPGVPLDRQSEQDLLWIRQEFLSRPKPSDRVVVHGHTPAELPQLTRWRIGVDTGAYATGVLTAVRLWGVEQTVLQARKSQNAGLNGPV